MLQFSRRQNYDPSKDRMFHLNACFFIYTYIFKTFYFFRPGSVVPTGLFQGIKTVNPTFRGYSQQVKLSDLKSA